MNVVELFAGTRSVSKAFERRGIKTHSIELDTKHPNIDWYADISQITAQDIVDRFGVPDVLWASPPCQSYSVAAIGHHRYKGEDGELKPKTEFAKKSDELLIHTLKIIDGLCCINPDLTWFIENPRAGMRTMRCMQQLPRYTITYCFAGETEIVTKSGIRMIGDLVDQTIPLLTPNGWVDSTIRSYGIDSLMKLVVSRSGKKKEVFVTRNHRWVLKDGEIIETINLKKGMKLAYCNPPKKNDLKIIDDFVARGFAFGDGYILSTQPKKKGFVMFCYEKKEMIPFFDNVCGKVYRFNTSDDVLMRYGYPREWKTELPSSDWTDDEKFSWIAGYIAADGSVSKTNGQVVVASSKLENLECLRDRCREIGIDTYGINVFMRKGFGSEKTPLYQVTIMRSTIPYNLFLRKKHKECFSKFNEVKHQPKCWSVLSVEETDRIEQTYCAEVPDIHVFSLNDGLLTHNCQYGDSRMKATDIWTNHPDPQFKPPCHYGDSCHERAPRGTRNGTQGLKGSVDRARIPDAFCDHIAAICIEEKGIKPMQRM